MILLVAVIFGCALTSGGAANINSRIIGGYDAASGQFPFIASIQVRTSSTGLHFCGGSLISLSHVITSGFCINGGQQFTIQLGKTNLEEASAIEINTTSFHLPPNFNPIVIQNDIGIIEFPAISLPGKVKTIALSTENLVPETIVQAVGWGRTSDGSPNITVNQLQSVYISTISNQQCEQAFDNAAISADAVCAEGNAFQGICNGDTGGPLIVYKSPNEPLLAGVASFISSLGCEVKSPSGFTRISPHLTWIQQIIGA